LLGDHQRLNAAVALATVNALSRQLPVAEEAIRVGLQTVRWAGRLQMVPTHAGQRILLDGAHNPAGAEALRAALHKHFPGERPAFILGTLNDKDCASLCGVLAPLTRQIWLAPVDSERTASPFELAQLCQKANASARVSACASLAEALACARAAPFVVITGSLYFIGEAMQLLGVSSASASERGLNEPLRATDP
jgi:dihydrofolate synthase/folylpolyglutamate synthase